MRRRLEGASSSPATSKATSTLRRQVAASSRRARSALRQGRPRLAPDRGLPLTRWRQPRMSVATIGVAPDTRASGSGTGRSGCSRRRLALHPRPDRASRTAWRATPSGSSIATSASLRLSGTGTRHLPGQATSSRSSAVGGAVACKLKGAAEVVVPGVALLALSHGMVGIDGDAPAPASRPGLDHAASLVPRTSGRCQGRCRSPTPRTSAGPDPQIPTAVTRTSSSPGRGRATSTRRRSPDPTSRRALTIRLAPGRPPAAASSAAFVHVAGRAWRPPTMANRSSSERQNRAGRARLDRP